MYLTEGKPESFLIVKQLSVYDFELMLNTKKNHDRHQHQSSS